MITQEIKHNEDTKNILEVFDILFGNCSKGILTGGFFDCNVVFEPDTYTLKLDKTLENRQRHFNDPLLFFYNEKEFEEHKKRLNSNLFSHRQTSYDNSIYLSGFNYKNVVPELVDENISAEELIESFPYVHQQYGVIKDEDTYFFCYSKNLLYSLMGHAIYPYEGQDVSLQNLLSIDFLLRQGFRISYEDIASLLKTYCEKVDPQRDIRFDDFTRLNKGSDGDTSTLQKKWEKVLLSVGRNLSLVSNLRNNIFSVEMSVVDDVENIVNGDRTYSPRGSISLLRHFNLTPSNAKIQFAKLLEFLKDNEERFSRDEAQKIIRLVENVEFVSDDTINPVFMITEKPKAEREQNARVVREVFLKNDDPKWWSACIEFFAAVEEERELLKDFPTLQEWFNAIRGGVFDPSLPPHLMFSLMMEEDRPHDRSMSFLQMGRSSVFKKNSSTISTSVRSKIMSLQNTAKVSAKPKKKE